MVDALGLTVVEEAAGELPQDACLLLGAVQQQTAGIGGDRAAVEAGDHLAAGWGGEKKLVCVHCVIAKAAFSWLERVALTTFMPEWAAFRYFLVRYPG